MTIRKYLSALLLVALCAAITQAGPPRRSRSNRTYVPSESNWQPMTEAPVHTSFYPPAFDSSPTVYPSAVPSSTTSSTVASSTVLTTENPVGTSSGEDALAEVNATRAQRGLPAYLPDATLNQAAQACAKQRAARLIDGHLPESDFAYLPAGVSASAAGCAAWTPDWGWGSCCTYDHYTYAGAAWSMGSDGKRYMHLFVR